MARNLELKVACSPDEIARITVRLADRQLRESHAVEHVDTYFAVPVGRLKMRVISGNGDCSAELIQYQRPDQAGSRLSTYHRVVIDTTQADHLITALGSALGVLVTVRKRREVAIWHMTRVHIDLVQELGAFVEIETVLGEGGRAEEEGRTEFEDVVNWLELANFDPIPGSYSDLLISKGKRV